jgi:nicotinate-nucleotide pyrophosphorylase (carboxylating)
VSRDFTQLAWNETLADDCRQLVRLAVREDLDRWYDWTTLALVPREARGAATVVTRQPGTIAGLPAAALALEEMEVDVQFTPTVRDGQDVAAGERVAHVSGSVRDLLTSERLLLNLLGRLCGVATLTRRYVEAIRGTRAHLYDTRKTTPGWRRLEKYAVRCGGGRNHRTGLFDAILIKDNHLALAGHSAAAAVRLAREFVQQESSPFPQVAGLIVEVEVDTLAQLDEVLPLGPELVLLDNMSVDQLRQAVARRDAVNPAVELEASGGVNLQTVRAIAETGVDRISVGALTHSAVGLDLGLDWGD